MLYYWTISGQLKSTFDRLFAVAERDPNYRNPKKESVLIMAAEGHGFEESEYWYDRFNTLRFKSQTPRNRQKETA